MTPEQIDLVQNSFQKIVPIGDAAAKMFYGRLFELDPSLRRLFQNDMKVQGRKLLAKLGIAVQGLHDLDAVLPVIQDLGRRHVGYGVEPRHYDTVAAAFLWTLERGLGDDFTEETERAWTTAYNVLSSNMIEAGSAKAT